MTEAVIYESPVAPAWLDLAKEVVKYNEVVKDSKVIGYALKNKDNDWFYAAKKNFTPTLFYTSNNNTFPVVLNTAGDVVDIVGTKAVLLPLLPSITDPALKAEAEDFSKNATAADVEIKEVEGVKLLFVRTSLHTKVFAATPSSIFQNAFKAGSDMTEAVVYESPVAPAWVDAAKEVVKYNEVVKDAKVIGYTLKNKDNDWFYAAKKNFTPTLFYTSNNNTFPVVLNTAGDAVDMIGTKAVLLPLLPSISDPALKAEAEDFAKNATAADVEIKEVEGVKLLFVRTSLHTKVFAATPSSIFQNAFKAGTDFDANTIIYDASKIQAPQWAVTTKPVVKYNKVEKEGILIGYTLKNQDYDWFYAPVKKFKVSFETNGGPSMPVVEVIGGQTKDQPMNPTRAGYSFAGWYKESSLTTAFDFTQPITADTVIYAKWTSVSSGGGSNGGSN